MADTITAEALRRRWRDGDEVALLDVREEGPYAEAHPFFAVSAPLSRLEFKLLDLVPRFGAPIVVYDDGEGLATIAAERIKALGYRDVRVLEGGLASYARHGELFRDVNVPSKSFGELVEAIRHTPLLPAPDLRRLIDRGADIVVLDARPFDEYRVMSIPGGISLPGGELALRARSAVRSPDTLVVVNCAGRTRSIIGAQSLIDAGLAHTVMALQDGTIGWTLAGDRLDHGADRAAPPLDPATLDDARAGTAARAARIGVSTLSAADFARWRDEAEARTLYCFDVRTPTEYAAGHPPGFHSAPGGQLVQALDDWVAVRGARIALVDDDGVRAAMAAGWLIQMGWEAAVIERGAMRFDETGPDPRRLPPAPADPVPAIDLATLDRLIGDGAAIIDLAPSPRYRAGHLPGAHFAIRSRFTEDLAGAPGRGPLVLTSPDGIGALHAGADARNTTARPVYRLDGGTASWAAAGRALVTEPASFLSPPIDVYKRPYEGTDNPRAAMQAYIDWELGLVAQLANDGICGFRVVR